MTATTLVKCKFYTLEKWEIDGEYSFEMDKPFMNVSVIEGSGSINERTLRKGDHFIIPAGMGKCSLKGKMSVIISYCD